MDRRQAWRYSCGDLPVQRAGSIVNYMAGWQWLLIVQACPSVLGTVAFFTLVVGLWLMSAVIMMRVLRPAAAGAPRLVVA